VPGAADGAPGAAVSAEAVVAATGPGQLQPGHRGFLIDAERAPRLAFSCPAHPGTGHPVPRSASSASMAPMCERIGTRIGESGRASARLAASSRLARSSSASVRPATLWLRIGAPGLPALGLLRYDAR